MRENNLRKIAFRAWDGNEIRYNVNISSEGKVMYLEGGWDYMDDLDWEVMQFTGLLDKEGKEIFEGDIVKITQGKGRNILNKKHHITDIYFNKGAFRYRWNDNSGSVLDFNSTKIIKGYEAVTQDVEIIGNIYQNPDLLTNKD